ncbi:molecular chaperone TorD family protein [Paracoccaceae bacterium Fryx2]|nr:molecular chaperone TorD family protein [Paracoccaceae bacterium Fryx2]
MNDACPTPAFDLVNLPSPVVASSRSEQQAWVYLWLADVFAAPPGAEAIAAYRRGPGADWLETLAQIEPLEVGVMQLWGEIELPLEDGDLAARLGMAHARLFAGVAGPRTVAPYESAHRGDARPCQSPVAEMEALLASRGLTVARSLTEPADHLSIQLTLLADLVAAEDPARTAFAQRLNAWVPGFCRLCVARDLTDFYAGAALMLVTLLELEAEAARSDCSIC